MIMKQLTTLAALVLFIFIASYTSNHFDPTIPKTWDDKKVLSAHLPLADSSIHVSPVTEDYYYRIPERAAYKTYPMYLPGREPKGYYDWLRQQKPAIVFNPALLKTEEDWIKAGEIIFNLPTIHIPIDSNFMTTLTMFGKTWEKIAVPLTREGAIPFFDIIVKEKGQVLLGSFSCATCHTKVMPDGELIKGAQGNYPFGRDLPMVLAYSPHPDKTEGTIPAFTKFLLPSLFSAPWIKNESQDIWSHFEKEYNKSVIPDFEAAMPGVMHRHGSNVGHPTSIPDLFDLKDRKYFDRTGLLQHRDITDLMLYAALNQGLDFYNDYGGFVPRPRPEHPEKSSIERYSDPQLYALAKYIYSLRSPANPNPGSPELIKKGKDVFTREGCIDCHTPPLYTNNKLTPAKGFNVPAEHFKRYDIYDESLETDPGLALYTRRGTGYYKVPSLRGAWNRTAFLHSGYFAALEDMFDQKRLQGDYVPTGYKPSSVSTMAITGHKYGLDLNNDDKKALIAFVKSLLTTSLYLS
jgi:hypothetical protein